MRLSGGERAFLEKKVLSTLCGLSCSNAWVKHWQQDVVWDERTCGRVFVKGCCLCLTLLLSLCSCSKNVASDSSEDYVVKKLAWASEQISADLALLTGSSERNFLPEDAQGGLSRTMDLVHDGSLELALSKVCAHAGYQLVILGRAPETPVLVHVQMLGRPCLEVLREIGRQTGEKEMVEVSEKDRRVTLRYGEVVS
ncbi:MAG: DotD/TraH family lipoprotein [Desulfovibrio sp.]|nr:DotD/TraH family lipoprotein [Desulfovibrio sp.]